MARGTSEQSIQVLQIMNINTRVRSQSKPTNSSPKRIGGEAKNVDTALHPYLKSNDQAIFSLKELTSL
jgi:hypothetical protein